MMTLWINNNAKEGILKVVRDDAKMTIQTTTLRASLVAKSSNTASTSYSSSSSSSSSSKAKVV